MWPDTSTGKTWEVNYSCVKPDGTSSLMTTESPGPTADQAATIAASCGKSRGLDKIKIISVVEIIFPGG